MTRRIGARTTASRPGPRATSPPPASRLRACAASTTWPARWSRSPSPARSLIDVDGDPLAIGPERHHAAKPSPPRSSGPRCSGRLGADPADYPNIHVL